MDKHFVEEEVRGERIPGIENEVCFKENKLEVSLGLFEYP